MSRGVPCAPWLRKRAPKNQRGKVIGIYFADASVIIEKQWGVVAKNFGSTQ
jgi:hypothetical protein